VDKLNKKDWDRRLSPAAKAEILSNQIHFLTSHMEKHWEKLPKRFRLELLAVMGDTGIYINELTNKDWRLIEEYWLDLKRRIDVKTGKTGSRK